MGERPMPLSTQELMAALNSVISIPITPFHNLRIDYGGHAKNVAYLMASNRLEGGPKRVIAIAGTSLVHHISATDQIELMRFTGEQMGGRGVLMSGLVPNPIEDAGRILEAQANAPFPPDVYLMMPLSGVSNGEGIFRFYMEFAERYGSSWGARFLYYLRNRSELEVAVRLINNSRYFIGVKIGTDEADVAPAVEGVNEGCGVVIWGIGDRSTRPAEMGARGHTSGINLIVGRASDEINNAQRRGDYETSRRIEAEIAPLEEIRFRKGRIYNYSAVVEAIHQAGFEDVAGGTGGPFNPRPPPEVVSELRQVVEKIRHYH